MRELDGREIRFVAIDKRYMRGPYPAIAPISASMGTYLTGQHINPEDEITFGNLTDSEMLGEVEIKPSVRRAKFPYVINPDNPVYITNLKKYNCKIANGKPAHPKDYAEAHFILLQDVVAENKREVKPGKHYFFLEDKEVDAKFNVAVHDSRYEAEKYIREALSISDHIDFIELLNLKYPYFQENTSGMSPVRLFEVLLKHAHEKPEDIIHMSTEEAKEELFISKLVSNNILKKRVDGFYDGHTFVARTLEEAVLLLHTSEGEALVDKWGTMLAKKESK